MRLKPFSLTLWLVLLGGSLMSPDYAFSGGAMGGATPQPTPVQPAPGPVAPRPTPLPPAVPKKNAVLRAQLIAQIKTKYAQQKNFLNAKYMQERNELMQLMKANWENVPYCNQLTLKMSALNKAYRAAVADLDQRRDAEIRGAYTARDLLP
jgi:hypothetical protein